MAAARDATRARPRWSAWLAAAAFVLGASFIACSGDGPTALPQLDLARSTLAIAPGPYVAGQSYVATFTARDGEGAPFTAPLSIVVGLSGGSSAGTFTPVTTTGPGVWTTTFSATTAGSASQVTLTVGGTPLTSGLPSLTVVPGPASAAESSVGTSSASIASGAQATITVTVRDALGNVRTAGGDAVTVGTGAGTSDGTLGPVTDQGNGTYVATFTGTATGTARTITAAIGGVEVTAPLPAITVTPGAPAASASTLAVSATDLPVGGSATLTLTARDAAGNLVGAGGAAVTFTKGAGTSDGTLSATTDHGDGTYSATFTATTPGTARTLGATIGGEAITTAVPAVTVTAVPPSLATSTVTTGSATLASGEQTTLTLVARDADGTAITTGGLAVQFILGSGTSVGTVSPVTDLGNGTYAATFTATTAGTPRAIGATLDGAPLTSVAPTITVVAGAASLAQSVVSVSAATVTSGATATLTLTVRDAAGNPLTAGGLAVAFVPGSGTSDGTLSAVTDQGDGTYTAQFRATIAGTPREFGATIDGAAVTSARPTVTVAAGAISLAQSVVTAGATTLAAGDATTLMLAARDAAGNAIPSGGETVVFTLGTGTAGGTISATTDAGDGTYTATFTATTVGTPRSIGATVGGLAVTSPSPAIGVTPGAISAATSTIAAGATTLASGAATTLALTARDAAGNTIPTGGAMVLFTLGAGTSDGTTSATTDAGDGTYTATFTATTAGSARSIGATIDGAAVTSPSPTITVTPGALSLAQTTVTVGAATLAAGDATMLTLTARDVAGNALGAGGATVAFTLGAGTSLGTVGPVTDQGDGTYTATFTATATGSARTVLATVDGEAVTSTAPTITVSAGAVSLAQSTVAVAAASVASGGTTTVTLTARDGLGNDFTGGGLTVAFSLGGGTSAGTFSAVTDAGDGTYTATFTATAAGTPRVIGATIGGQAVTSTLPTITVTPGPPSIAASTVTVGATSLASGASTTLTLTVRDAAGNVLGAGGLTIAFTPGAGTSEGTIGAVTDHGDGTYSAPFTATTAGTARAIGATIGGEALTSAAPTITVTPGAASLAQSAVTVGTAALASGASTTLTLTARDGAGNQLASGGLAVAFVPGDGTSTGTISAVTDHGDGTYSAIFTATTAGTPRSIGATIGGEALTSALPTITVTAGPLSLAQSTVSVGTAALASGASTTLTLTARDADGNAIPIGGETVVFTRAAGTSDGVISGTTDEGDGTYTATFTATVAGTARAIGATVGGVALTSAPPTITVTPGAPSLAQSSVTVGAGTLASGTSTAITLTVRDAAGNLLGSGGLAVDFVPGTGTSEGTIGAVTDHGDGTYSATFTATSAGTPRAIGATIGGQAITSAAPTITVTAGAVSTAQSVVSVGAATLASGAGTTLTLTARDAAGNAIPTGGLTVAFTLGAGTSDGTISAITDQGDGTYTATFTATSAGTARAVGATIGGEPVSSALPAITVTPGPLSPAQSTVSVGSPTVVSGAATSLTLVTRDAAGNQLTNGGLAVAFTLGAGTSAGTISAVTDHANGTYSATFTATTTGSARSIGATIGGEPVTSTAPSITVTAGSLSLAQSSVAVGAATLPSGEATTLTLTARDAAGNVLGGGLVVAFTLGTGSSAGEIGAVTDHGDGTYSATFTATIAGTPRAIGATIGGESITSTAPTITVTPGAASVAQSLVTVGSASVAAGQQTTLTLTVRDAAGNALTTGGLAIAFTLGDGTSDGTVSTVTDAGDGTYTATFSGTVAGTARSIGATIGGAPLTSAAPTIAVTPGPLSLAQSSAAIRVPSLASGDSATITVTARDAFGNALGAGGATVEVGLGGGTSTGVIGPVADGGDGTYRALFTASLAGTARSIVATIDGDTLTSPAPTVTVTPGALSLAQTTVTVGTATLASGAGTTLTLTARDAAGNTLGAGGATVLFTKGAGTSDGVIGPVADAGDGSYTATFTATTAGSARAIGATVGGEAATSASPTITVTPGAISAATSTIAAAPASIALGQASTLTLTGRDAAGNLVTTGGATVVFTKVSGSADGPLSATTDVGDGTYTATFTAAVGGTPRVIGATIDGVAVTTPLPAITVVAPPLMELGAASVTLTAQQGALSDSVLVAVANVGGDSLPGLVATSSHVSGPATCASLPWLVTPTFDEGGVANPVSLMRLRADAAGLELGTCVRRVIVTTTAPDVAPETTVVSLVVGRSAAATGVVNVVMMGDAGNNVVQNIQPTPVLTLDNAGRGTVTNLSATILAQSGFAECVDPFDESTCTPWLAPADLVFSSPQLPSTLSIVSQVRPFSATATVRVSGTGMTPRDFNINVAFNVLPELVTNPRNLRIKGVLSQNVQVVTSVDTVIAFNQNSAHGALTNYRIDPAAPPPTWLRSQLTPLPDGTARLVFWVDPGDFSLENFGAERDTVIESATGWRNGTSDPVVKTRGIGILADCVDPNDCFDFGADSVVPRRFELPFSMVMEPGLTLPFSEQDPRVTLYARDTTTLTFEFPVRNLGAGEIAALSSDVGPSGATPTDPFDWLSAELVGGASSTPATVRLTVRPGLVPADRTSVEADVSVRSDAAPLGFDPLHRKWLRVTLRRLPPP